MRRAKSAPNQEKINFLIYHNLENVDNLPARLGEYYETGNVTRGGLLTFTTSINQSSNPTEYEDIKRNAGPFQTV